MNDSDESDCGALTTAAPAQAPVSVPTELKWSCEFDRLSDALEWATEYSWQELPTGRGTEDDRFVATPMLVLVKHRPYKKRSSAGAEVCSHRTFVAMAAERLEAYFASFRDDARRYLDEVVPADAPCKYAIDCDWKVAKHGLAGYASEEQLFAALEQSFAWLVATVAATVRERYAKLLEPCVTSATAPGKWSKHVVFHGAVWKSQRHCAAMTRELIDTDAARGARSLAGTYLDLSIYNTNHCLRMYRCSKVAETHRSFRRPGESSSAPVDGDFLFKSCITFFEATVSSTGRSFWITSVLARKLSTQLEFDLVEHARANEQERALLLTKSLGEAPTTTATATATAGAAGGDWRCQFQSAFAQMGAYQIDVSLDHGRLRIRCKNHECAIRGGRHTNENIFLQVDLLQGVWRQNCFNVECRKQPTEWQELPDHLYNLVDDIYKNWNGAAKATELAVLQSSLSDL